MDDYNEIKKVHNKTYQDFGDADGAATSSGSEITASLQEALMSIRGFIDKSRYNIQSFDKKIKFEKDHLLNCQHEKERIEQEN